MTFFTDAVTASEANLDGYEGGLCPLSVCRGIFLTFFYPLSLSVTAAVAHFTQVLRHKVNFSRALKCPLTTLGEHMLPPRRTSS